MSQEGTKSLAEKIDALFDQKRADGTPRYAYNDYKAARALFLLEISRIGEFARLSVASKVELAIVLQEVGVDENTPPAEVEPKVKAYFKKLKPTPSLFTELDALLRDHASPVDRAAAAEQAVSAYRKLTDNETARAPKVGEQAPEDSTAAQTLQQKLGVKVRI